MPNSVANASPGFVPELFSTPRASLWQLEAHQVHRIAEVDLAPVAAFQLELIHCFHRLADEERATLPIEGAIGAEEHAIGAEEVDAAANAARPAVDRRVVVEHLEVVDRTLLHPFAQPLVIL